MNIYEKCWGLTTDNNFNSLVNNKNENNFNFNINNLKKFKTNLKDF